MTVIGQPFEAWVHETIDVRNANLSTVGNLNITMDPEVYEAF